MNRLWVRLTAAFLVVTWIVLAVVAVVVYRSVESSFQQYVGERNALMVDADLLDTLETYYADHWQLGRCRDAAAHDRARHGGRAWPWRCAVTYRRP